MRPIRPYSIITRKKLHSVTFFQRTATPEKMLPRYNYLGFTIIYPRYHNNGWLRSDLQELDGVLQRKKEKKEDFPNLKGITVTYFFE